MQRRTFGDTGLDVSAISLGCWIFGVDWWGQRDQADCDRMCAFAFDRGVTFFDNGDAYGNGRAETLFGKWVASARIPRDKVEIGGKFGYDFYTDPGTLGSHRERKQDFSAAFMRKALEQSLERLGTHNIKLPQFNDELFAELEKVRQEGKIRVWGVSLGPAIGWREEGITAIMDKDAKAVQTVYNLFEQAPGREFCEVARAHRAGVLARVQDNSGVLKDVIRPDMQMSSSDHRKFRDQNWRIYGPQKVEKIRHIAAAHNMTIHQLACKWLLMEPALTSITATLVSEQEIAEVCDAVSKPDLTQAEMDELAMEYARDWGLGEGAHPCDLKSSTAPGGAIRSNYVPPPVLMA
jgi:aryl-alcohol dehydrogenase-like predicted oxidoreductase